MISITFRHWPTTHVVCNRWFLSRLAFLGIIIWGLVNTIMTTWVLIPFLSLGVILYEWRVLRRLKALRVLAK